MYPGEYAMAQHLQALQLRALQRVLSEERLLH